MIPSSTTPIPSLYGLDPGMTCRVFVAHALWLLGYPDQALQKVQEALTLARELSHPLSTGRRNYATSCF
jgi:hypothetical protein